MGSEIKILNQAIKFAAAKDPITPEDNNVITVLQDKMEWITGTTTWTISEQLRKIKFSF